ncbi:MAG: hypothetical protein AAGE84_27850 [Cyanobacteria bacterium P01_G01_bin.39]
MSIYRRKFTKITLLGGASFAASSGILFPKPAESFEINLPIGKATSSNIFEGLLAYAGVKIIDAILDPPTQSVIQGTEQELEQEGFNQNRTSNGKLGDSNVIWGQDRTESQQPVGLNKSVPNPGFAIQNTKDLFQFPKIFTASTSVSLEQATEILFKQVKLMPEQIQDLIFPWSSNDNFEFSDVTSWLGNQGSSASDNSSDTGLINYRTRQGQVARRYERLEAGLGRVKFDIESPLYNGRIITYVDFT